VHPETPIINPMSNPIDLAGIEPPPFGRSLGSQACGASDCGEKKVREIQS
jgi:hypothetical protein